MELYSLISREAHGAFAESRTAEILISYRPVGLYPTAGSSDDYAYSPHIVDCRKGKIIAYTVEYGRSRVSTPFHPPYDEMRKVMREVTSGLLELCASVAKD